jgi:phage-related protein
MAMSFGGAIKLTGEQEYRNALKQITTDLGKMSDALETQANDFTKSNKNIITSIRDQARLKESIQQQKDAVNQAKTAYQGYATQLEAQKTRHNALTKEYRDAVKELDRIGKESGEASDEYQKQAKAVSKLEEELTQSNIEMDESKSAMSALKKEIASGQATYENAEKAVDGLGKETKESGEEAKKASEGFSIWKGILADLGATAIKGALNGIKNLGAAFVDMGKQSLENYAQFEQLEGGVQKLFGDDMTSVVKNANDAFKTAGMDVNTYMETVTGFSASLISGLGGDTAKAATLADQAIRNMSDNANTFGTDMDTLQKAYQGFAKGNFNMLDSLSLGYGGTKGEMLRLVKDAGVVEDSVKSLDDVSFDQMISAIGIIQDRMQITGTTANEASKTIEGSANAAKAAWQNFLTGIADDGADFEQLTSNLTTAIGDLASNLLPRIQTVISGVGRAVPQLIRDIMPQIMDTIPPMLSEALPTLISTVSDLVQTMFNSVLPELTTMIMDLLPDLLIAGIELVTSIMNGVRNTLPTLLQMLPDAISDMVEIISEYLPDLVDAGAEMIMSLVNGLEEMLPTLLEDAPRMIEQFATAVINQLPTIIQTGVKIITALINGLISALPTLVASIPRIIGAIVSTLAANMPQIINSGKQLINALKNGIVGAVGLVVSAASQIGSRFISALSAIPSKLVSVGTNMVKGIWNGINNATSWIIGKIRSFGDSVVRGIKSIFGIHSPSSVMRDAIGKPLAQGIGVGFEDEMKSVTAQMQSAIPSSFDVNSSVSASGSYLGMVDAFKQALSEVRIELDDEVAGRFVDKTVTRLIYT